MELCRLVDILERLVPSAACRGWLIGRHRERCPLCQARLASREEVRRLLVKPEDIVPAPTVWPAVRKAIGHRASAGRDRWPAFHLVWKRAAVWASAGLLIVVGLWLFESGVSVRTVPGGAASVSDGAFKLNYIRVGGEPATAYIYQPQGVDFLVVWAQRNP